MTSTLMKMVDGEIVPLTEEELNYVAPAPSAAAVKRQLLAYVAGKRFKLETGGFTYRGHAVDTSRDSQGMLGNAALGAQTIGGAFSAQWKCKDGTYLALDHAGMIAFATSILNFVNGCFSTEAAVAARIDSGSITTRAEVDAAAWPPSSG